MSARVVTTCTWCGEDREHYVQKNGYPHRPCLECRTAPEYRERAREGNRRYAAKPEKKAQAATYRRSYRQREDVKAKHADYMHGYERREEVMAKRRAARKAWYRRLTPEQKAELRAKERAYHATPEARFKAAARRAVARALESGKLTRPECCQGCGAQGEVEAHHHRGYEHEHRLDVLWLCTLCHGKEHRS